MSHGERVTAARAPKPDPLLASRPASFFLGKYVKKGFYGVYPPDGSTHLEHMWVKIHMLMLGPGERTLRGKLANDPVLKMELRCGDEVSVRIDEISEVKDK